MASPQQIYPTSTGGSSQSHLASRNPYRTSSELSISRNPYRTTADSASMSSFPSRKSLAPSSNTAGGTTANGSSANVLYEEETSHIPPPAPTPPTMWPVYESHIPPVVPPRPLPRDSPHPDHPFEYVPPLPPRPSAQQEDYFSSWTPRGGANRPEVPLVELQQLPPRRLLTSGDIPVNAVGYTRDPRKVVAYLIPLPAPIWRGQAMKVPQRYMIYTPPAAHLLKPPGKESKRHRLKRLAQQEVKKAKTYDGRTVSLKGLHSKTLRGVDWAVTAVRNADITFLNRVPRKEVDELILLYPTSVVPATASSASGPEGAESRSGGSPPASHEDRLHHEFTSQLVRAKRRAARHTAISTALFAPALAIDTLAAIVWPFGGLAEIDGVWMYASVSGYLTARSVTKRLQNGHQSPPTIPKTIHKNLPTNPAEMNPAVLSSSSSPPPPPPPPDEDVFGLQAGEGERAPPPLPQRMTRPMRFREELNGEDENENNEKIRANRKGGKTDNRKKNKTKKTPLKVQFIQDEAMSTMEKYFQEVCHQRNPRVFRSSGVPPTKTDVLASIGWWPDKRGVEAPSGEEEEGGSRGDWDDENWQTRQVKEDLDKVMKKAAKSWDQWCKSYAKYPERAMKEKGHSRASALARKLRFKKESPTYIV